jgi:hypothetical protein
MQAHVQTWVTVLLVTPLINLPLRPTAKFESAGREEESSTPCFELDTLADYAQGQFLEAVDSIGLDFFLPCLNPSLNSCSASIDPTWQLLIADVNPSPPKSIYLVGDDRRRNE